MVVKQEGRMKALDITGDMDLQFCDHAGCQSQIHLVELQCIAAASPAHQSLLLLLLLLLLLVAAPHSSC
jgi:hypothetical protein